jgi:3-phosphoshikimate 1-carboxyvinyltransferase
MDNGKLDCERKSPWGASKSNGIVELMPPIQPPKGRMIVPGSKSLTNRALIMAAMAQGSSRIGNILRSDDSFWCIDALRRLGAGLTLEEDSVLVEGTEGFFPNKAGSLFLGAAGTIARFLPGALAASAGPGSWQLEGSEQLSGRPIGPVIDALRALGGSIRYLGKEGCLPVQIDAGGLTGGRFEMSGAVSSQFISGLLMAAPYAEAATSIVISDGIVQHAYVSLTTDMMARFGVQVDISDAYARFDVRPGVYKGTDMELEADASSSCYPLAYAALTGGYVRIDHLSERTRQPDIGMLELFERMGCTVERGDNWTAVQGPADGTLHGGFTVSMREMSDQTLTLAVMAPFADGPITITGVGHIRHHECDRIAAVCESLDRVGIRADERQDGLTVYPGDPAAAELDTYDDHRVAMSLSLLSSRVPGIKLRNPGCVSKTFPAFFEAMEELGMRIRRD